MGNKIQSQIEMLDYKRESYLKYLKEKNKNSKNNKKSNYIYSNNKEKNKNKIMNYRHGINKVVDDFEGNIKGKSNNKIINELNNFDEKTFTEERVKVLGRLFDELNNLVEDSFKKINKKISRYEDNSLKKILKLQDSFRVKLNTI